MSPKKLQIKPFDNQTNSVGNSYLAPLPSTMYLVAAKRSGKTTLLLNLLQDKEYLKGKFNRIIFVSPTARLDEKVKSLMTIPNLLKINHKLIKLLKKLNQQQDILDNIEEVNTNIETKMTDADFIEKITVEDLQEIIAEQGFIIENFGKSFADDILIVLDDSIIFISQSYYALPKSLRLNNSQVLIWELQSNKEVENLYSEMGMGLDSKKFKEIYKQATAKPYSFLNINFYNDKPYRFIQSFEKFISLQ